MPGVGHGGIEAGWFPEPGLRHDDLPAKALACGGAPEGLLRPNFWFSTCEHYKKNYNLCISVEGEVQRLQIEPTP